MKNKLPERFYGYKHYTLEVPERCFYVGRGTLGRPYDLQGRNAKWKNVVAKHGICVKLCTEAMLDDDANKWEIKHIVLERTYVGDYPDDIGCNFTRGGEGCTGGRGGRGNLLGTRARQEFTHLHMLTR